jgi:hypothetical protein
MANAELPYLITTLDVGIWLSMPTARVLCLARAGKIPCLLLPDGEIAFDRDELTRWSEGLRQQPREEGNA